MTVATPTSEADLAALVADAARAPIPLEIRGGGTRAGLGRPVQAERTVSTAGLSGITLYEPGALTLVVKAGTPMAEIDAALAAENQILPFEPMDHRALLGTEGSPTIGGAVAVAAAGPRRIQRGACRDAMIGVRFVDGAGTVVRNGGRVMKNVTGYDLVKLMAGSHGTLGILTEISFKLLPAPRATHVLGIGGLSDTDAVAAMSAALGSPYDVSGAAHLPAGVHGAAVTMLRIEGLGESVAYRSEALRKALAAFGDVSLETNDAAARDAWIGIRDARAFEAAAGSVWRLSVRPGDAPAIVRAIGEAVSGARAFYDWGGGLVWLLLPEAGDAGAGAVRAALAGRGHATLVRASAPVRAAVEVFEPEPAPLARISAGLRAKFDPHGILNPGRMRA